MNNSVFGKTMENLRKRVDVKLVTDEKKLMKLTSKPTFVTGKIFDEKLVAVHKINLNLTLNRRAYVGMYILDISKTLMYDSIVITLRLIMVIRPNYCSQILIL